MGGEAIEATGRAFFPMTEGLDLVLWMRVERKDGEEVEGEDEDEDDVDGEERDCNGECAPGDIILEFLDVGL